MRIQAEHQAAISKMQQSEGRAETECMLKPMTAELDHRRHMAPESAGGRRLGGRCAKAENIIKETPANLGLS